MKGIIAGSTVLVVFIIGIIWYFGFYREPAMVDIYESISNNETAFVIPLTGANKTTQGKFGSVDYLEENKVASKRILIPQTQQRIGRYHGNIKWIPSVVVIKVNRSPVTREWTKVAEKGTTTQDDAIAVESKDSIGFSVGINITCAVNESDAAVFLYNYPAGNLADIMDTNVRGVCASVLSREFGSRDLTQCKADKKQISETLMVEVSAAFIKKGITVTSIGIVGGLLYDSKDIQKAIDDGYIAEQRIKIAEQQKLEQDKINERNISIATAEASAAVEFAKAAKARTEMVELDIKKMQAEALKMWVQKWNGNMPSSILPQGSQFLMGMDVKATNENKEIK